MIRIILLSQFLELEPNKLLAFRLFIGNANVSISWTLINKFLFKVAYGIVAVTRGECYTDNCIALVKYQSNYKTLVWIFKHINLCYILNLYCIQIVVVAIRVVLPYGRAEHRRLYLRRCNNSKCNIKASITPKLYLLYSEVI
jgi:hypothetical protein